jgi:flagellar biosynthetic protein FliR
VLVAFRLSGLFVFAPVLAGVAIPMKVKVLLCAVLAIAMFGLVRPAAANIPPDFFSFAALAAGEVVFGLILGLLALIPVIAAQIAGIVMGQQMGLGLATLYNPSLDVESDVTAEVLLQLALVAFLVMGGLEVLFITVARSYTAVPIGAFSLHQAPLAVMNGLITSGCELALRVSTPLLGLIFVETIAGAILMKTIPQINIMSLGYGLKVLLGLLALILAYRTIGDVIIDHLARAGEVIMHWAQTPAAAVGGF